MTFIDYNMEVMEKVGSADLEEECDGLKTVIVKAETSILPVVKGMDLA